VVIGISTLTAPWLAEKRGTVRAIITTQATSTIFIFATPFAPNYILTGIVYSIRGFLMDMASPIQESVIMGFVAVDERGAASGAIGGLLWIPNAVSTTVRAWFWGLVSSLFPFTLLHYFSLHP
jgi:MFS family permease